MKTYLITSTNIQNNYIIDILTKLENKKNKKEFYWKLNSSLKLKTIKLIKSGTDEYENYFKNGKDLKDTLFWLNEKRLSWK